MENVKIHYLRCNVKDCLFFLSLFSSKPSIMGGSRSMPAFSKAQCSLEASMIEWPSWYGACCSAILACNLRRFKIHCANYLMTERYVELGVPAMSGALVGLVVGTVERALFHPYCIIKSANFAPYVGTCTVRLYARNTATQVAIFASWQSASSNKQR